MKVTVDNKCPGCGANIKFNPTTQKWDCEYCGSSYSVEEFEKIQAKEEQKEENNDKKAKRKDEDIDIDEYNCPNCGATVLTDANTTATFCVYCGNTAIMKNRLQGEFKPDKIIPFKTKKEEAIEAFKINVKKRWFAPSNFSDESNIEKISGVYIPFWLYDSKLRGNISARAEKYRYWSSGNYDYKETRIYDCIRDGELEIIDLPVDGSTKFADEIMDSIEPYNYKDFKQFNRSYLSGFLAEKYDLDKDAVYERAEKRMKNTIIEELKSTMRGYDWVNIKSQNVEIEKGNVEYALLPVWMLNIKFKGKMYTFAMNGQTKKITGYVPLSLKAMLKKGAIFFVIFFAIIFIITSLFGFVGGIL